MTVVDKWIPSPHHSNRHYALPEAIVLHFTGGNGSAVAVGRLFQSMHRKASSHYTIDRDGTIVQHVAEARAAWHAGDGVLPHSFKDLALPGRERWTDTVNRRTIGIELCNRGWKPSRKGRARVAAKHSNPRVTNDPDCQTWEVFPSAQIEALCFLMCEVAGRWPSISMFTGHDDLCNSATIGDNPKTPELETKAGGKLDPGPALPYSIVKAGTGLLRLRFDWSLGRFVIE